MPCKNHNPSAILILYSEGTSDSTKQSESSHKTRTPVNNYTILISLPFTLVKSCELISLYVLKTINNNMILKRTTEKQFNYPC